MKTERSFTKKCLCYISFKWNSRTEKNHEKLLSWKDQNSGFFLGAWNGINWEGSWENFLGLMVTSYNLVGIWYTEVHAVVKTCWKVHLRFKQFILYKLYLKKKPVNKYRTKISNVTLKCIEVKSIEVCNLEMHQK